MKKSNRKVDIIIVIVLLLLVAAGVTAALMHRQPAEEQTVQKSLSQLRVADFADKNIGVVTGTIMESFVKKEYPEAKISYFNNSIDLTMALSKGKVDAFLCDPASAEILSKENPGIKYLDDTAGTFEAGVIFPKTEKGEKLKKQMDEFLTKIKGDGTLDALMDFWNTDEAKKTYVDTSGMSAENGTLKFVTAGDSMPSSYLVGSRPAGHDVDIAVRFCREYGYGIDIIISDFSGVIPGLMSGLYDFSGNDIVITDERKESVNFSVPYMTADVYMMIKDPGSGAAEISDYNGRNIGILTGSSFEPLTLELFPDSKYFYFNNFSDLSIALRTGKIDAFIGDIPILASIHEKEDEIDYFRDPIGSEDYYFAFARDNKKSEKLCEQFNEFLAKSRENGTLDEINAVWTGNDTSRQKIDDDDLTGENGTLNVVTNLSSAPFSYLKDNSLAGITIDLTVRFCREYGYSCEFSDAEITAMIAGLVSGNYDFAASPFSMTEERKQNILFSDAFYTSGMGLAVRASDLTVSGKAGIVRYSDYDGKKVGIQTGTSFDAIVTEKLPDAKVSYYNSYTDLLMALESDSIDAFAADEPVIKTMMNEDSSLTYINDYLDTFDYGFAFAKNERGKKLCDEMSKFIRLIKYEGIYSEIGEIWFGTDESKKTIPPLSELPADNGVVKFATESSDAPFVYRSGDNIVGYEIDIIYRFCKEYGYGLQISDMNFDAIIPSIQSGKSDCGASSMSITEERAESVYFSESTYRGGTVLAVKKADLAGSVSSAPEEQKDIFGIIAESFEKNFIREERWKLIVLGIIVTMTITVASVILGSVLAFGISIFRRTGSRLAVAISRLYVKLLQGTPMVVLLMILYYVVLGKSGLDSLWVAIIGFALNFGAYASEIMRSGIESIDGGQREAALALGYNENQAFFRFIFPQAARRFMPVYVQEIVSLLKNTSIVGYIAIQDLTKMSDIIRSRTYEAFFPLIATAVIYFILAWIISLLLKLLTRRLSFDRKKK